MSFEIIAVPQGANSDVFPEVVVATENDRHCAALRARGLQMESKSSSCLYGIRASNELADRTTSQ
ncbi:hypothetical protein [Streptomyces decoyicus]